MDRLSKHCLLGSAYAFLITICLVANPIFAAKQGVYGQTSTGSIGISLHIPDTKRLYIARANPKYQLDTIKVEQDAQLSKRDYCLSILDLTSKRSAGQYKLKASSSSKMLEFRIRAAGQDRVFRPNEDIETSFSNQTLRTQELRGRCDRNSTYLSVINKTGSWPIMQKHQITLTLIPE